MDHHVLMAILDARDELLEHGARARLGEAPIRDDEVEELTARNELHHHVNICAGKATAGGMASGTASYARSCASHRGPSAGGGGGTCGCVDDLIEADDVGVVEELEDLDLAAHLLVHLQLADAAAVEDLDSHLVASQLVLSHCRW